MMDGTAVGKIADLAQGAAQVQTVAVEPGQYVDRPLHLPPLEAVCEPVELATLASVVDYVEANPDEFEEKAFILVEGATRVSVMGPLTGRPVHRECYAVARHEVGKLRVLPRVGAWLGIEDVIIGLQSEFAGSDHRDKLLKILGNLQDELVSTLEDDGVTQQVQVRAGIARRAQVEVPRVVELPTSFSTFPEAGSIVRRFILRMKSGVKDGAPMTACLIDADPLWQTAAAEQIQAYLREELERRDMVMAVIR